MPRAADPRPASDVVDRAEGREAINTALMELEGLRERLRTEESR